MSDKRLPERKHLRRLDAITVRGPIVFYLTVCVEDRKPVLVSPAVVRVLVDAWAHAEARHGWLVGRYVVMPDHVYFFASPLDGEARSLSEFMRCWKWSTAMRIRRRGIAGFRWQREFFDHLLRSSESYAEKWEYVRQNPVRAKLVTRPEDWPHQGEISVLEG